MRVTSIAVLIIMLLLCQGCGQFLSTAIEEDLKQIRILSSDPPDQWEAVDPTTTLRFNFNSRLNANTITDNIITVRAIDSQGQFISDKPVRGSINPDLANPLSFEFIPDNPLMPNQRYQVTLNNLRNLDHYVLEQTKIIFTTGNANSTTPTTGAGSALVLSISPNDNALNVALATPIQVIFTQPINAASISSNTLVLVRRAAGSNEAFILESGEITYDDVALTLKFVPDEGLKAGQEYQLDIMGIMSPLGDLISSMTFETVELMANVANVFSHTPLSGATKVNVLSSVQFMFDGPIDANSITDISVTIDRVYQEPAKILIPSVIHGKVVYDESALTLTFIPDHPLAYQATYKAKLNQVLNLDSSVVPDNVISFKTYHNSLKREIYYQIQPEQTGFGEMRYYTELVHDNEGKPTIRYRFHGNSGVDARGSGLDNKWLTADDWVQTVDLFDKVLNGMKIKEIRYASLSQNVDRNWRPENIDITGYKKDLYQPSGVLIGTAIYSAIKGIGADDVWFSSDDEMSSVTVKQLLQKTEVLKILYTNPGDDGDWLTGSDNANLAIYWQYIYDEEHYHLQRFNAVHVGDDGIPQTSDDTTGFYVERVYDEKGVLLQAQLFNSPAETSRWFGINEYVLTQQREYQKNTKGQTELIESWQSGADETWSTSDDTIVYYEQFTYDNNGNRTRYARYIDVGADGQWYTADDVLSEERTYLTDR